MYLLLNINIYCISKQININIALLIILCSMYNIYYLMFIST